jgi:beta-glucosidase
MGFQSGDEKRMTAPLDYIGVNYYFRRLVSASTTAAPSRASYDAMGFELAMGKDGPLIEIGWEVYPRGLYDIVQRVSKDYRLPIEITENGCSYGDYPDANGRVADNRRIDYYREHLRELAGAIRDGADLAITPGLFSIILNGPKATPSALAWSTSIFPPSAAT